MDPELALALRVSMEEERARQEAAAKEASGEAGAQVSPSRGCLLSFVALTAPVAAEMRLLGKVHGGLFILSRLTSVR
jgi:hypothetical protein